MSPARPTQPILATPTIAAACALAVAALAGCKGGAPDAATEAPVVTTTAAATTPSGASETPQTTEPSEPATGAARTNAESDPPRSSGSAAASWPDAAPSPATSAPAPTGAVISDAFDSHPPLSRVMLASGLLLEDLVIGAGSICVDPEAVVTVRYTGRLRSGVVFDWTPPGKPVDLPLAELIAGWREGVPGMRIGGKRRLTIPADLGYGRRGLRYGNQYIVPPDSDLIFEIELLGFK